jgi:hypothetical protein
MSNTSISISNSIELRNSDTRTRKTTSNTPEHIYSHSSRSYKFFLKHLGEVCAIPISSYPSIPVLPLRVFRRVVLRAGSWCGRSESERDEVSLH